MRLIALWVVINVIAIFAQAPDIANRVRTPNSVVAMQLPFTWSDTINVAAGNYTVPDSIIVGELRVADSGDVRVDLPYKTNVIIKSYKYDVFRLQITGIDSTSTTAGLRSGGKIRLSGFRR